MSSNLGYELDRVGKGFSFPGVDQAFVERSELALIGFG